MQIEVRYFAALREAIGREREMLEVPATADVAAARAVLANRYPTVAELLPRCVAAVNRAYVAPDHALHSGDELAFIPPLGGGTLCPR